MDAIYIDSGIGSKNTLILQKLTHGIDSTSIKITKEIVSFP